MKKAKTIGKKTLSVFLAVLMVLTAWVWVAPQKASAAAGSYYVKITWQCTDAGDDYDIAYPGYADKANGNCVGISLYHKSNNGTGTESEKVFDLKTKMGSTGSYTEAATITGFPTSMYVYNDHGGITDAAVFKITKIEIGASSTSTLTTLWTGEVYMNSTMNIKYVTLLSDGTASGSNDTSNAKITTTSVNWVYPYAKTFTWSPTTLSAMTCPKTTSDSTATQKVSVTAKDQYGVQMFDPTWSVKGSNKSTGITVSPTTSSGSTTISVTSAANIAGTTNSQTGTVTATWSTPDSTGNTSKTSSKTFTINDATYTATFKNHRNADGVLQSDYTTTAKYGVTPTAPTASDYSEGDYDYTFTGWNPSVSGITSDTTYTATYSDGTFVGADYTAVNDAIAAADAIKEQYGTEYELKYTYVTRTALDSAINKVVTGLGRTQQETVDGYAQAINDAIAALEPNKFDVIFLDKNGAILLYNKNAEYKSSVTAPDFPEDQKSYYDAENHYTYSGWDSDEYTSVLDDLVIAPVYTAEAHDWEVETVTSTCVQAGTQKYTCRVCGYVKYDGGDQLGDHVWETDYTVDLESTCVLAGSKSIHCSLCDAQKDITAIDPKGHTWEDFTVAVNPTCTNIGVSTRVCAEPDCKFCEHLVIDALGHSYTKTTVAPTCTVKGYDEYVCQNAGCSHSYRDNYTNVIDHNYGEWETVSEAYCEVAGVKKQTCTECGFVNLGSIDALSHDSLDSLSWNVIIAPTCEGKGYQTKTCSKCNNVIASEVTDALTHNYTVTEPVKATCTSKGYTVETCTNCGDVEYTNEVAASGHAWTTVEHAADCTHSAYIEHICGNDATHNYNEYVSGSTALLHDFNGTETIIDAATCEADGEKTVQCKNCEETTTVIIPKLGHSYGEWEVVKEATNTADGQWKRVCTNNTDHVEYITIPKGGHEWDSGTVTETATCTETGKMVYACTKHADCGITVEVTVPVTQHTVAQKVTDATCTNTGSVEAYCTVCSTVFSTKETEIKAHDFVAQDAVAPTCTTSGYTPYKCSACGFTYNEYDENAPAPGHDFSGEATVVDATCSAEGSKTVKCSRCSKTHVTVLPKVNHKYIENGEAVAATCTTPSTQEYKCEYCGAVYTEYVAAANGHSFGAWEVVTAATADKNGVQKRTCSECGTVEYGILAPIGDHVFAETITTYATCTTTGEKSYTCSEHENCSANYTEKIPATGHTEKLVYNAPSCIAEGSTQIICETCNAEIASATIPVLYHDFSGEGVITDEATCEGTGTMTYTCLTDGCTATKTETLPAKGHALTTTVTDATCGEKGSVVTTCANCTYSKTTELAAKGHIWNAAPESTDDADCENNGSETYKCQNCEETNVVVLPKLGHTWGAWQVTASTNSAPGSVSRTCSTCKTTETVEIPAGGHNLVVDTANSTAATCTTEGTTVYKCENHDDCGIILEVTVPVAQHGSAIEKKDATCKEGGYIKTYCPTCKTVFSNEATDKIAHVYVAGTPVDATCTTSGYTPYACSCGDAYNVYDETKPANGHDFDETVEGNVTTIAATCTTDGSKTVKCKNCAETKEETLLKTGHNHTVTKTTAATCTNAGTEVYTCACGNTYTVFVEEAKDHTFGNWTTIQEATTSSYGIEKRVCSVCDAVEHRTTAPTGAHAFEKVSETSASCTSAGSITWECKTHENCEANYTETLDKLAHTEKIEYTAPTCIAEGSSKIVCSVCDAEIKSEAISVIYHDFSVDGVKTDATCTADGVMTYTCKTEGCTATKTETIPAKGHALTTTVNDATCTKEGSVVTKCSRCNEETLIKELPVIEHSWNDGEIKSGDEASCEADGTKTYTCTADGCTAEKTETVAKLGHDWDEWTVTKASTNTEKGILTRTCSRGCTETADIPAGGHNLVETSREDASCTAEGSVTYTCDAHTDENDCGITVTVTLAKIQHELETTTEKEATCEETGLVVTKCQNCNEVSETTIIPATGHTLTVTTTPATCISEGSVVEDCDNCDYSKTTTLAQLDHSFTGTETPVKDATCTEDGSKTVQCKNCEETTTVIIPKLGHKWGEWDKVDATNDTDGSWTRICQNNPDHVETVVIPAGGHELVEDATQYVAPTCETKGKKVYICNNDEHTNCTVTVTVELDYAQHTIVKDNKEATCTAAGYSKTVCSVCAKEFNSVEIPVKAHVYTKGTPVDATCTTSGYTPYACSCGDTYNMYDETKPATGHTLTEGASTAACTAEGVMTLSCEDCSYTTNVKVPALGHSYVENADKATEATCGAAATKTYECSRCTDSYTISEGDKLTGDNVHTWGAWIVKESATASSLGYQTRSCNVCGQIQVETIPATGEHNYNVEVSGTPATCTAAGSVTYKCSTHTGDDDCGLTSTIELPATGHTEKHEYEAATCTAEGYSRMICSVCDEVLSTEAVLALGHNWNDGNVTNATCNTKGKIVRTCQRTGCTETHTTTIAENPNAHRYETTVTDATCTTTGSVVTKCKLCGDTTTEKTLPVIEHSWNDGEIKSGDEASCEADGTKTYTCTADDCTAEKTETVAKLGHDWDEWTVTKASTNTEKGILTRTCSRGCTETADIPAGGHNLVETSREDASCTAEGSVTYTCDAHTDENDCGITVTVTLAKIQHELETTTEEATCDVDGSVVTKCKNCNEVSETTIIPATGHAWNEGVVTTAATCTSEGTRRFTCAHDETHQYTAVIEKVQHKYVPGTPVDPTCTSSGYTPYRCENCDSAYSIITASANGHDFTEKVSSTATCTVDGVMTLKCADCDETMKTDVPALGHDYQLQSTTSATCAAAATETYKCSRCEASYTVSVGSKLTGDEVHEWNDWVTVENADYDSIGYKTRTCKACDKLEVETIPATGAHNLVESNRDNSTCTENGTIYYTCDTHDDCGVTSEVVIPKLGHDEELSYLAASCTAAGYAKIVCTRCGELESKVIDKLDHSWVEDTIINSTCSAEGSVEFNCENCTETKTVVIPVNADAHKLTMTTEKLSDCKEEGLLVTTCTLCNGYRTETILSKLQHSWGAWSVTTPSTNDAEGEMTRKCDNGCEETVKIPAGGHAFRNIPDSKLNATCTAEGSATYKCTAHASCGVEITVTLDKIQHELKTESENATCEKGGFVKVYCSVCNEVYTDMTIGKLAHNDKVVETKEATCTTVGYTTYECESCKRSFSKIDAPADGHKYLDEGAVAVTNATCTTAGYTTYNCDNCDETHTENIVSAKGHDWTEWTVTKQATNTEKGMLSRTCKNGCGETETAEIPAGGHSFDTEKPVYTTTGTCLTEGEKTFKCTAHDDCGITITVKTELGAHAWSDWTKVDATNDTDGSWTRKCATCQKEETLVIPKGDHEFGDTPGSTVPASCKANGTATYNCTAHANCGVTITVVLEKIQHTPDIEKKDASCTENGYVKTYCTVCSDVISNVVLEKTGHVETTTERKESTCIENGYEKVICKCGTLVSEKELPLIAHNYDTNGDGKVDKTDAVFADGTYTYICQQEGCGHTISEDSDDTYKVRFFDASGNQIGETQNVKYGDSAVAPASPERAADANYHYAFSAWDRNFASITSDLDVYPTYEKEAHFGGEATCKEKALCEECGTPYGTFDETKHIMTSTSTPATCEKNGVINYYCTLGCGYGYSEEIQKLNHNYGAWTVIQQGTCETPHIQQRKCLNYGCGATEEYSTYKSHSWLLEPAIAPTCTTVGYTEFKYCTVCNLQVDRQEVAKLSHNDLDGNGYCDYCGTSQGTPKCNCMCHSTGIMKIFYGIVRFFWIITKSSPSCSCGASHY